MEFTHSLNRYKFIVALGCLVVFILFFPSCKQLQENNEAIMLDEPEKKDIEKEAMEVQQEDTGQETPESKVELKSFKSYYEIVSTKIDTIQDDAYRKSFYEDRTLGVLKAMDYFNDLGFLDKILEEKVDSKSIIDLFYILKGQNKSMVSDYLVEALEQSGDAVSFIVSSNYYDFDTGLSAYISDKYNIPYFIVSFKDGAYRGGRTGFKSDLDQLDQLWKREGLYMEIAPFIGELNFARKYGGYENIHFDKTKDEIMGYLEMLLQEHDTVYYFSNVHGQSKNNNKLLIYSSSGLEFLVPEDIASVLSGFDSPKRIIFIGHHCYSKFEKDLSVILDEKENIEYMLLPASEGKSVETNMLQAINYASDGILTIGELEDISDGIGSYTIKTFEHELGERKICYYLTDIPGYIMEIECEGVGDLDIKMYSNFEHQSIFYYLPEVFKPRPLH